VARPEGADATEHHDVALSDDPDGRIVTLRAIEPEDAPALRRAFEQLSPVSRYRRFQRDVPELTEEMASYLTRVDGVSHLAWIAVHVSPDLKDERIVGVARAIRLEDKADVAEIAVTVADDFQRHGLGRILLEALGAAALRKGIRAFRAEVLASNEPAARSLDTLVAGTRQGELLVYEIPLDAVTGADSTSVFGRFLRMAASPIGRAMRSLRAPGG
jgi:GNAT superfamily N-acetyltransferase